jgi:hypothetical protein
MSVGEEIQHWLDDFEKAVRHEAAEKQRAWASTYGDSPAQQALRSIINEAANMIDPYKGE